MCQVHSNCMQLLQCTPVSDMWKSYFYADPVQSEKFQLGRRSIWDSLHGILVVRTVGWHRVELVPVHGKVWHHQVLWISTPCLSMQGCGQSVVFIKCLGPRAVRSRYIKSPGPNDIRCQQVFSILFHPFPLRPPIGLVANLPNPSLAFSSVTEIISLLPLAEQFGWEFATLRLHIGDLWSFHLFDSPPEFMGPSRMRNLVGVVALLHVRMDVAAISSGDPQCHHSNNCHGPFLKVLHHPWRPPFSWHQNLTTNVQLLGVHSKLQSVEVSNLYLYFSSPCQLQLSANVAPPRHKGRRKKDR